MQLECEVTCRRCNSVSDGAMNHKMTSSQKCIVYKNIIVIQRQRNYEKVFEYSQTHSERRRGVRRAITVTLQWLNVVTLFCLHFSQQSPQSLSAQPHWLQISRFFIPIKWEWLELKQKQRKQKQRNESILCCITHHKPIPTTSISLKASSKSKRSCSDLCDFYHL